MKFSLLILFLDHTISILLKFLLIVLESLGFAFYKYFSKHLWFVFTTLFFFNVVLFLKYVLKNCFCSFLNFVKDQLTQVYVDLFLASF